MEYKNDGLSVRFIVPDKITVRQQLAYLSDVTAQRGNNQIEKMWIAARGLITEWECNDFPDMDMDLDKTYDPRVTDILVWSALEVKKHINALENIPKNS